MFKVLIYYLADILREKGLDMEANSVNKKQPDSLYELCLSNLVNYVQKLRFYRNGLRQIPDSVLMDVYYKMYQERRLCILGTELSALGVFDRLLRLFGTHQRLLQCFQAVTEHGNKLPSDLAANYELTYQNQDNDLSIMNRNFLIDIGLRLGGFLNEAGWYAEAQTVLIRCQKLCLAAADTTFYRRLTLECCHRLLRTQSAYCCFPAAAKTYELALLLLGFPNDAASLPTLPKSPYALSAMSDQAVQTDYDDCYKPLCDKDTYNHKCSDAAVCLVGRNCVEGIDNLIIRLYKEFSLLFFVRCDYNAAYKWSMEALRLLNPSTPIRVTVEVIRACGKACVVKRRFGRAGVLLRQAAALATGGAARALALQDYGFYLLNVDSIHHSVAVYEEALTTLRNVFGRESLHVATAQEDLAYALYVMEYSSGRFYKARDHAERAIRIIQNLVPPDHLLLASAKRVKALILEEIALDTPAGHDTSEPSLLEESEALHKAALNLSMMAFGEKNVQTAKHYGNLGRLYQSMQKFQDAEAMHLKAIAIKEELLGVDDYEVGLSVGHLASLYNYHMNQHAAAEHLYLRSIAISLKLYGEKYSGLEYDYRGLVHAFTQLKRHERAETYTVLLRRWYQLREESRAQQQPAIGDERLLSLQEIQSFFFSPNAD